MYNIEYFAHSLAQASGVAGYQVHQIVALPTLDAAYREIEKTMTFYNQEMNDGFIGYVKFRVTGNDVTTTIRWDYRDATRSFTVGEHTWPMSTV